MRRLLSTVVLLVLAGGPAWAGDPPPTPAPGSVEAAAQVYIDRAFSQVAGPTLTFPLGTKIQETSDGVLTLLDAAGTSFSRLQFGGTTNQYPALKRAAATLEVRFADDSGYSNISPGDVVPINSLVTSGSGTGVTVNNSGLIRTAVYKVTLAKEAWTAAALTQDITIATLPAKTFLQYAIVDVTAAHALGAATLTMRLGSATNGNQFLLDFDSKTPGQYGDAQGELGASLATATAPTPLGFVNWGATNIVNLRLTSSVGNLGTGAATSLTAGAITLYLVTTRMP